ncbi:hypothetical protein J3T92_03430 [Bifidobacterium sp. B4081]|uniref:hypothetical protein n=1 Tax=unclassified Bifidobacterium TaxID=2608897 RepID=UPI002269A4AC|nr:MULTISPECIES: hypothetical protein [unclassified Bifidobacterium]MCX8643480.1 hypothetical protein [Bifidobacterium sp. B4077]MCX8645662.1 hypothetical protein [Bifidobacterium sp. B4081]MCX8668354.1 hypothetical protein [Bifidobacterium sp. B3998]
MKVLAIIMNALSLLGLALTVYMQMKAGIYSDEYADLYTHFDQSQSSLLWICILLFFILLILSLSTLIYFSGQAKRKALR